MEKNENIKQNELYESAGRPSEMVEFQEGSIVSRTLIAKSTGTVTLFAFDRGQGLSEHTAPFDAMVYILEGEAVVIISGREHNLAQGEAIIMPADKPHALRSDKGFKMVLIMIK